MNTLKFSISVKAINSYIYSGHFFLILATGEIAFTPLSNIMRSLVDKYPKFENLIRVSFQRNDYLFNTQSKMLFGIGEIKYEFSNLWKEASKKINFNIDFNFDDYEIISTISSMPVLDLKLYAMKMFVGAKKGLYEIDLRPEDNRYTLHPSKPKKRFDAKVIGLSAKSGQVMISGGSNGLFHGTFLNEKNQLKVVEKALAKKSLRTSWSSYDTINYEKNNAFDYFVNEIETLPRDKKPIYSKFDEHSEPKKITKFGKQKFNLSKLLENSTIESDDIKYCFNSSQFGFFFMNDDRFVSIRLERSLKDKKYYFISRDKTLPNFENKYTKPISSSIFPNGCVVEYMDKVVLYQNSKTKIIETKPSIAVRTFPSSIRYRNLISIVKEHEVSIHSVFPFDEGEIDLTMNFKNEIFADDMISNEY